MKILILEDEQRNAMHLIRLLNDIDATFVIEGPFTSIKEAVEFFQSRKTTDLILGTDNKIKRFAFFIYL